MTCHDMKRLLDLEGRGDISALERQALDSHLEGCTRCAEAAKVARLSSALLGALREEIAPSPTFYARLRARMATDGGNQTDTTLFQVWDFARRLVPALALGVLLLAGVTISMIEPRSLRPAQTPLGREIYAFSLEELNLPAAVERPSQDQMLAFVLMRSEAPGAGSAVRGTR